LNPPFALAFDRFVLDPVAGRLYGRSGAVPLTPKASALLEYLASNAGRLLTKHELLEALWPRTYVTDGVLKVCIREIRRALGDDPSHASLIETIPRRGYRFVGTIESVEPAEPVPEVMPDVAMSGSNPSEPHLASRHWRPALAAALVIVIVIAAAIVAGRSALTGDRSRDASVRLEQIAPPGTTIVSGGAVSPSGRHLAFVARDERTGRTALWIRAIDAVDARALPDTEGASHPFFSPDGQVVAFFRNGQLIAADVTGKRQRTIAPVGGAPAGGSWGADDVIVFAEWMTGLFAVASTGGRCRR